MRNASTRRGRHGGEKRERSERVDSQRATFFFLALSVSLSLSLSTWTSTSTSTSTSFFFFLFFARLRRPTPRVRSPPTAAGDQVVRSIGQSLDRKAERSKPRSDEKRNDSGVLPRRERARAFFSFFFLPVSLVSFCFHTRASTPASGSRRRVLSLKRNKRILSLTVSPAPKNGFSLSLSHRLFSLEKRRKKKHFKKTRERSFPPSFPRRPFLHSFRAPDRPPRSSTPRRATARSSSAWRRTPPRPGPSPWRRARASPGCRASCP